MKSTTNAVRNRLLAFCALACFGCSASADPEADLGESQAALTPQGEIDFCKTSGLHVIIGTSNNDVLTGTPAADCIVGLGGQDTINGLAGDDFLFGGDGDDVISGGDELISSWLVQGRTSSTAATTTTSSLEKMATIA